MIDHPVEWQPSASIETLQLRSRTLQKLRAFFSARGIWEVETPILSQAATVDPHIESFAVLDATAQITGFLHTSPEFAMKRLLAAGSGSIYQVSKVFRQGEVGRRHNPEFTLIEWYRTDFDHQQLMGEVDTLIRTLLDGYVLLGDTVRLSYRAAFMQYVGIDPFISNYDELKSCAAEHGIADIELGENRDAWLDLLVSHVLERNLPRDCPVFIYDYPATQAALARIRPGEFPVSERFELYINGMELANGFHELGDSQEQRQRFEQDLQQRASHGLGRYPVDERFLQALVAGLPDCAGVALGFDRLMMLATAKMSIIDVISFDHSRA